jgi:Rieske 2Fe-2S family protein
VIAASDIQTWAEIMPSTTSPSSRVRQLLLAHRKFFSLPGEFYSDPEIYQLDLEAIFQRKWIFAGVECEIPNPGDYFTLTIGSSPILVLRDRAGAVRAFFNTCRHRGSKICLAEKGTVRTLICPYHQWNYDLTGLLVGTSRMHEEFDREQHALGPINVRTSGGTIYVCLAQDAPDFDIYGPLIEPYLAPHGLANAKLAHQTHVAVKGNWKLVMENSRECFHCPARHHDLMHTFLHDYNFEDPGNDELVRPFWDRCATLGLPSELKSGGDFRVIRLPLRRGAVSITTDGKPAVSRLLGAMSTNDAGSVRWVHFPSTFNHALAEYAVLVRMLPLGPQETLFTTKWLVHRDAEEGRDYDL